MNNVPEQLKEIATAVMYAAEARDTEQVLERISHISRELVHAKYAALGVPDGQGGLRFFKVSGIDEAAVARIGHLPHGKGLLGAIMHERKTLRLENMHADSRAGGFCKGHPHMASLLGVPVQIGQQLFGILYLSDRLDGQPFTEQDEWLVETMAGYAALAIAGSHLTEQQSKLTLLEERERIGMELHDGVIQSLYALGMHLELLRTTEKLHGEDLKPVMVGLDQIIEDIRSYILNLKTPSFRQKTIMEYFQQMLSRLHIPETLSVEIDAPEDLPPFTPATFESICLIANEAISNAVRHADATVIKVTAYQEEKDFIITVADNGRGFNLSTAAQQQGLGLRNVHQRARLYGGHVEIDSKPEVGTVLKIVMPL